MSTVYVHQTDAHLASAPVLVRIMVNGELRSRATFVAISNFVTGSGDERRERSTAIRWTCWGAVAEAHGARLTRGSHVNVFGYLQSNSYRHGETGEPVYMMDFTAESVDYLDTREVAQQRAQARAA